MAHSSILAMQTAYFESIKQPVKTLPYWYFCDNQPDADECARLVLSGEKTATAPSLWELTLNNEPHPTVGDLAIITNWQGVAQCIIQTTKVEQLTFAQITPLHALAEGEGDKSLVYWQKVHWDYYQRIFTGTKYAVSEDLPILFEHFKVVFR